MLKIAVVTPSFPPYKGGMGNVAFQFACGLDRLGHEVHVFTPDYGHGERKSPEVEKARLVVRYLKPIIARGQAGIVPQLFILLKGYDVVHLHFPFVGATYAVLLARLIFSSRLVVHYHFDLVGTGLYRGIFSFYRFITIPLIVLISDRIIATSRDYLMHSNLAPFERYRPQKYTIIPNGVLFEFFNRPRHLEDIRNRLSVRGTQKVVLFVGALDQAHYFKGLAVLIAAWRECRYSKNGEGVLIVVGKGGLKPSYESLSEQLKVKTSVIFTGRVPDSDLPSYYQLADVTVLPSIDKSEAFGLVLVESMASGTPVIASDLPGVRSVVERGKTGWLVRPNDSSQLAMVLGRALQKPGNLERMRTSCVASARKLDWSEISRDLELVFKKTIRKT